jgi:hypothetical protein
MLTILVRADDILRRRPWTTQSRDAGFAFAWLMATIVVFGLTYGGVMGSFGGISTQGVVQVVYSAFKVPLLLLATFLVSLPSFVVISTLLGLRGDLSESLRALVATQAGLAIILASLAPFTAFWYAGSDSYTAAVAFNGLMFAVASFSAQWLLRGYYQPLVARNRRHRTMLRLWVALYAFVAIQMAWILRPFIGAPGRPAQFLRDDVRSLDAYVTVIRLVFDLLR